MRRVASPSQVVIFFNLIHFSSGSKKELFLRVFPHTGNQGKMGILDTRREIRLFRFL